ncbi:MAG: class II fructose-bisphosphate aldolase, partial [Lentisphaeria bacterium]|nr:class II fructose-bisphosphate aldolase [Lentisphaeria bacterium]
MALVNFREMLAKASAEHYAVGMFDVSDLEMARAVVQESEKLRAPVILGALGPDLEGDRLEYWFAVAELAAKKSSMPVCIHLDHANTLEEVMRASKVGFTSVMLDASASPFEENVRRTREVVDALKGRDITVEAELGHVGNGWVGSGEGSESGPDKLTEPEKVAEFVERTGVDALAVSIGTAHGVYVKAPKLDIARLEKITEVSRIPLVLHGGSGTPEDQMADAIAHGISKV